MGRVVGRTRDGAAGVAATGGFRRSWEAEKAAGAGALAVRMKAGGGKSGARALSGAAGTGRTW